MDERTPFRFGCNPSKLSKVNTRYAGKLGNCTIEMAYSYNGRSAVVLDAPDLVGCLMPCIGGLELDHINLMTCEKLALV
jgi:hypothetical protein